MIARERDKKNTLEKEKTRQYIYIKKSKTGGIKKPVNVNSPLVPFPPFQKTHTSFVTQQSRQDGRRE